MVNINFRNSKPYEKLLASTINLLFVSLMSLPFICYFQDLDTRKIIFILSFFLYNIFILIFNKNRCLGMVILNMHWQQPYVFKNHFIYVFLYTLSFSTAFIWIFFPFDLLIFNLLIIQLPTVLITKTTLHGYLSGRITSLKLVKTNY